MDKKELLTPTAEFGHFSEITPEFLKQNGIKGLLCDIDDTLVTHNYPLPTKEVEKWVKDLKNAGILLCFVSNNYYKRVKPFAEKLNVPFFCMSGKPAERNYKKAVAALDLKKEETAMLGDQLFTDIKGANLFGITSYKVNPIGEKATLWIKIKRKRERKIAE